MTKLGTIALNESGILGYVTCEDAWKGITLMGLNPGSLWEAKKPIVVGHIDTITGNIRLRTIAKIVQLPDSIVVKLRDDLGNIDVLRSNVE